MTIRESIIHYQDKQGITNLALCKECGVNKTVYSDFRNCNRNLPYEQLQRILDFLKLQITEL